MADNIKLTVSVDGIRDRLSGMLNRAGLVRGWLNRVAYPKIIAAQRRRWITEGGSEGQVWAPLNPMYATRKLRKFADYPGGGRKMLIATGRLVDGMTGDNTADHYKMVTDRTLETGTTIDYARYVSEKRNIVDLSEETKQDLIEGLSKYLRGV
jgi:hypothetical protein